VSEISNHLTSLNRRRLLRTAPYQLENKRE
jgi:hypothetical protein